MCPLLPSCLIVSNAVPSTCGFALVAVKKGLATFGSCVNMYREILDMCMYMTFLRSRIRGAVSLHNRVFLLGNLLFFHHIFWLGNHQIAHRGKFTEFDWLHVSYIFCINQFFLNTFFCIQIYKVILHRALWLEPLIHKTKDQLCPMSASGIIFWIYICKRRKFMVKG